MIYCKLNNNGEQISNFEMLDKAQTLFYVNDEEAINLPNYETWKSQGYSVRYWVKRSGHDGFMAILNEKQV